MKILCFDTSFDKTYLTLADADNILASEIIESTDDRYHSAFLISKMASILGSNGLLMKDIDAVGVNVGPGSFTGIRVCVTIARIIAQSLNIPAVGVPSLEILAHDNKAVKTAVMMDARKGKSYLGVYSKDGDVIFSPEAVDYDQVLEYAEQNNCSIIADRVMTAKAEEKGLSATNFTLEQTNYGLSLLELVKKHIKSGEEYNWQSLTPLYIQPPPISMPKCKK